MEYGRIIAQLAPLLSAIVFCSVDLHDVPEVPFVMQAEVRKLKYLLESLV